MSVRWRAAVFALVASILAITPMLASNHPSPPAVHLATPPAHHLMPPPNAKSNVRIGGKAQSGPSPKATKQSQRFSIHAPNAKGVGNGDPWMDSTWTQAFPQDPNTLSGWDQNDWGSIYTTSDWPPNNLAIWGELTIEDETLGVVLYDQQGSCNAPCNVTFQSPNYPMLWNDQYVYYWGSTATLTTPGEQWSPSTSGECQTDSTLTVVTCQYAYGQMLQVPAHGLISAGQNVVDGLSNGYGARGINEVVAIGDSFGGVINAGVIQVIVTGPAGTYASYINFQAPPGGATSTVLIVQFIGGSGIGAGPGQWVGGIPPPGNYTVLGNVVAETSEGVAETILNFAPVTIT